MEGGGGWADTTQRKHRTNRARFLEWSLSTNRGAVYRLQGYPALSHQAVARQL